MATVKITGSIAASVLMLSLGGLACNGGGPGAAQPVPGTSSDAGSAGLDASSGDGGGILSGTVTDASGSPRLCADLFDQKILPVYEVEISADNWARLDADFHDIKDVLAGTPPQTYYPITFRYGSETVSNAAIRLRGKSSWVDTVMFDPSPKMQFDISFDQIDPKGKFHGVGTIHLAMPRDDWTFLNERVGNNWFRQIGIAAPCSNSAKVIVNGAYYGLYVAEGGVNTSLLKQFYPDNWAGDLFKNGTEADTNMAAPNWGRLQQLQAATDIAALQAIVDLPHTVLEWAAEAAVADADGYYGGSHNYYLFDEGGLGYVWLPDHTDSAFEWLELFTPLSYREHPIFWWVGRPIADPPGPDYLIVMNDPTWRARYTDAIATQVANWDPNELIGWFDTWSAQIADAVAADPHKWATADQVAAAQAAFRDLVTNRPVYLESFVGCERGNPADSTDQDGDGVPWCNDCNDADPSMRPGIPEVCGNGVDDNCNGLIDEGCPGTAPLRP
jgi:hypothetical protein